MQLNPLKTNHFSFVHLWKSVFICGLICLASVLGTTPIAQRGGKAEANRIEFARGSNSTTLSGTVRGDEQAEYVLSATQGQRLVIKLTSVPPKSSVFDLHGPDGVDLGLEYDANYVYSGKLPRTGDYLIFVTRPTQAKGTSRYRLTVWVR
jgi:hypothetical protein